MIDLESLNIFRTVVEEGGVVRAAAKLNRVQSNVTTRIRQLEERLGGVHLFRRTGRTLALSADGHTLLAYAERLLRLADEAANALANGRPRGRVQTGFARKHGRQPFAAHSVQLPRPLPRDCRGARHRNHGRADQSRDEF